MLFYWEGFGNVGEVKGNVFFDFKLSVLGGCDYFYSFFKSCGIV